MAAAPGNDDPLPNGLLVQQEFMRRFMSPYTQAQGVLLCHALGTGKCIHRDTRVSVVDGDRVVLTPIGQLWSRRSDGRTEKDGDGEWRFPKAETWVRSYGDGAVVTRQVLRFYSEKVDGALVAISLGGGKRVSCTGQHQFLVAAEGGHKWVPGADLRIGMEIVAWDGDALGAQRILSLAYKKFQGRVYDLEVEGTHTYLAEHLVSHNTCTASAVIEHFKGVPAGGRPRPPALVLVKGQDLKTNFTEEVAKVCTKGVYSAQPTQKEREKGHPLTPATRAQRLAKAVQQTYQIETWQKFLASQVKGVSNETLREKWSDRVIVVDEVHAVRIQAKSRPPKRAGGKATAKGKGQARGKGKGKSQAKGKGQAKGKAKEEINSPCLRQTSVQPNPRGTSYDHLWRLLHVVTGCRVLLLTGTPIWDQAFEFAQVLNLLLPADEQLPSAMGEFNACFFARGPGGRLELRNERILEEAMRGRISFLRPPASMTRREEVGTKQPWLKLTTVYPDAMSEFQAEVARRAWKEKKTVPTQRQGRVATKEVAGGEALREARDAANFVYPKFVEGAQDEKGRPVYKEGEFGTAAFKKWVREVTKGKDADIVRYRLKSPLDKVVKPDLRKLSAKFASIIGHIEAAPEELVFVYTDEFVQGAGAILLGLCLEKFGFRRLVSGLGVFCEDGRIALPKKPRYIVVTSASQTTSSAVELGRLKQLYNHPENRHGEYIRVIIGSEKVAHGLSFKNFRQVHVLAAPWNLSSVDQALGRIFRYRSHLALDPNERYARVFRHVAVERGHYAAGEGFPADAAFAETETVDIHAYRIAEGKEEAKALISRVWKRMAFDCALNYSRNVQPTDVPGSADCDYRECNYVCADFPPGLVDQAADPFRYEIPPELVDRTTYDLLYAGDESRELAEEVKAYFAEVRPFASLQELAVDLAVPAEQGRVLLATLDRMIGERAEMRDKFGFPCYLKEDRDTYFLDWDFDLGATLTRPSTPPSRS